MTTRKKKGVAPQSPPQNRMPPIPYEIAISVPANGRIGRATVELRNANDKSLIATYDGNLVSATTRKNIAKEIAAKVNDEVAVAGSKLDDVWRVAYPRATEEMAKHQQEREDAAAQSRSLVDAGYEVIDGAICRMRSVGDQEITQALCNFSAKITAEMERDDGVERKLSFAIEGALADGTALPPASVSVSEFSGMSWVVERWGTRAIVYAGQGARDHLRVALQILSGHVPRRTVYTHTGWREIAGQWCYLHQGGAIGPGGVVPGLEVHFQPPLDRYHLPAPPDGEELRDAVRASLGVLRLGPARVMYPVLAATYRAALGLTDYSLHLVGPTGSYKSELAALAQQHFGPAMKREDLPASWSSTANSLMATAFAAKDALLTVDDFCPTGSLLNVQRAHAESDRLLRGQGNGAGRGRCRPDGTPMPSKPPRGLIISTGEDTPRGRSLRARLLILDVESGDLGPPRPQPNPTLTALQADASAGKYAAAMAGFVRWVAPRYASIRSTLHADMARMRETVAEEGQHARTPTTVADLCIGLQYVLDYAQDVGAITPEERAKLWAEGEEAIREAGRGQAGPIADAEPAAQFVRLITAAIASGRAHLAGRDGGAPANASQWGWHLDGGNYRPRGRQLGWIDGDNVYLEPNASFAEAQKLAVEQGDSLPVTLSTLKRRLKDERLLATTSGVRETLTIRKVLQGQRREVIHVSSSLFQVLDEDEAHHEAAAQVD